MFYSHLVLTKKGPLGNLWLAAQLGESRISKSFASSAKISVLCQSIEQPAAPFALRLSAHLVLGVVRVHSRKAAIVLANAHKVMQALHRLTEAERKRPAPASDEIAAFSEITLPERPRKRSKRLSNSSKLTLGIGHSPNRNGQNDTTDQYGRSAPTMEIELNIQGVDFGRQDVQHLRSSASPYTARERDITLDSSHDVPLGGQDFGFGLGSDLDYPAVGSLDGASDQAPSFDDNSFDFAPAFSKRSTPRVSPLSGKSPVLSVLQLPSGGIRDTEDQIPLPYDDEQPAGQQLPDAAENLYAVQNAQDGGNGMESAQTKRTSTETVRSKRSRGMLSEALLITEKTEFTNAEVLAWADDTSDTIYHNVSHRPIKRRRKDIEKIAEEIFFGHNPLGFAPAIEKLWRDTCVLPTLNELGLNSDAPEALHQAFPVVEDEHRIPGPIEAQVVPPAEDPFFQVADDYVPLPVIEYQEEIMPIAQAQPAGTSVQSSPSKQSGGISVGQSSGSLGPEMLRDRELEVTQEDREEFRRALQSHGLGPAGDEDAAVVDVGIDNRLEVEQQKVPVPRPSVAGSDDEMHVPIPESDDARMPVDDAELRLAEPVEAPVIGRLNVQSFKVLQMLRKSASEEEVEENERVVGFNEFVQGTSRRACARAFLNLVGLASAGYVRVQQKDSYGDIDIFRGDYF